MTGPRNTRTDAKTETEDLGVYPATVAVASRVSPFAFIRLFRGLRVFNRWVGARRSAIGLDRNLNRALHHADAIGAHRPGRHRETRAGLEVELPTVQRAGDHALFPLDPARPQRTAPMRAGVIQRVKLSTDVEDRDASATQFDGFTFARRQRGGIKSGKEVRHGFYAGDGAVPIPSVMAARISGRVRVQRILRQAGLVPTPSILHSWRERAAGALEGAGGRLKRDV